jgi:hypothetical protein
MDNQIQDTALDSLSKDFGENIPEDGMSTASPTETHLPKEADQTMAESSINKLSFYMMGDPQQCSLPQLSSRYPEMNPTIWDSCTMQPEPYRASNHKRWLTMPYTNAHGLNHIKLAQLEANISLNMMSLLTTWLWP